MKNVARIMSVMALAVASLSLVASPAATGPAAAAASACGSACNNKPPTYRNCIADARAVGAVARVGRFPNVNQYGRSVGLDGARGTYDGSRTEGTLQAAWYYSPSCQTLWADVRNLRANGKKTTIDGVRSSRLLFRIKSGTAGSGWRHTPMIDARKGASRSLSVGSSIPGSHDHAYSNVYGLR